MNVNTQCLGNALNAMAEVEELLGRPLMGNRLDSRQVQLALAEAMNVSVFDLAEMTGDEIREWIQAVLLKRRNHQEGRQYIGHLQAENAELRQQLTALQAKVKTLAGTSGYMVLENGQHVLVVGQTAFDELVTAADREGSDEISNR